MVFQDYKKFIGSFIQDKYLVFVLINAIYNDDITLELLYYNRETGEIDDPDFVESICEISNNAPPMSIPDNVITYKGNPLYYEGEYVVYNDEG